MLSYRHGYHAGNAADVLKHFILLYVLDYVKKKDKTFIFIDSHAGAGKYSISDPYMQKNKEYLQGIQKILKQFVRLLTSTKCLKRLPNRMHALDSSSYLSFLSSNQ